MSGNFSITNNLVNKTANFFAIDENDAMVKKGAKVFGKTLSNAALVVVGAIETVVFAILTAIASPLNLANCTKPVFQNLKNRLELAANGTATAAKNLVRNIKVEPKKVEVVVVTPETTTADAAISAVATIAILAAVGYALSYSQTVQDLVAAAKSYVIVKEPELSTATKVWNTVVGALPTEVTEFGAASRDFVVAHTPDVVANTVAYGRDMAIDVTCKGANLVYDYTPNVVANTLAYGRDVAIDVTCKGANLVYDYTPDVVANTLAYGRDLVGSIVKTSFEYAKAGVNAGIAKVRG